MGRTTEVVIGTGEGVVKAWAIKRRLEGEKWDVEWINGVRGTPAEPIPGQGKKRVPVKVRIEVEGEAEAEGGVEKEFNATEGKNYKEVL